MPIKNIYKKATNLCLCLGLNVRFLIPQLKNIKRINTDNAKLVLFYLPNGEWFNGGILSIFFLIEKTSVVIPNTVVLPVIASRLQRCFRMTWFKNPFFLYNLLWIKSKVRKADKVLIHIPECLFGVFCANIRKYKLDDITKKATVNILNQNAEVMPPNELFDANKELFGKLTMTLAFRANMNIEYPFLDLKQTFISAWLYGDDLRYVDFEEKKDICIISPDPHPLKDQVIAKIEQSGLAKCIVIRNMPFDHYRSLRLTAKWAISFGEGYDGYFGGVIIEGGVGLCVDNQMFSSPFIDANNLPYNVFTSYEQMLGEIVDRMRFFEQNPLFRKQLMEEQRSKALESNSPDMVLGNLSQYYRSVAF